MAIIFPTKFQFRDQWYALAPPWLSTDNAEKYMFTMQACSDVLMEKMNQAIKIRMPGQGDPSQLPYLAFDRALSQGPAEPDAHFVTRLTNAFQTWGLAGSARSVLVNLQAYFDGQNVSAGGEITSPYLTIVGGPTYQIPYVVIDVIEYEGQFALVTELITRFDTGSTVVISGVTGTGGLPTAVNGTWVVNAVLSGTDGLLLVLEGSTFVGAYTSGGSVSLITYAAWNQLYQDSAIGDLPTQTIVTPSNFNWDGQAMPWRSWLIISIESVQISFGAQPLQITDASGGSLLSPGQNISGSYTNADGVSYTTDAWVPATSGAVVNTPFVTVTGLSGMVPGDVGKSLYMVGFSHFANGGQFQIAEVLSPTSVVIVNPQGVAPDSAPTGSWSLDGYPAVISPGPSWGTPNIVFGQGQLVTPDIDIGSMFGGVWQPSLGSAGDDPLISWGLYTNPGNIQSIRDIVKTWKSAGTYYPNIVIAFDSGDGASGSSYSPNSVQGSGNPDGSFGSVGRLVNGVWSPARFISSNLDCYCQGTGVAQQCSVENIT